MDTFSTLSISKPNGDLPADNESGGSGGSGWCVVAARPGSNSVPVNEEAGGSGGSGWCVIA